MNNNNNQLDLSKRNLGAWEAGMIAYNLDQIERNRNHSYQNAQREREEERIAELLKSIDIDTAITMKKVMFCYVPEE